MYRSGTAATRRPNSSGVSVRLRLAMIFGSSVWAHGLVMISWSRTARSKIECSIVWYLRIDVGDRPSAAAFVTQPCTTEGRILAIDQRPK